MVVVMIMTIVVRQRHLDNNWASRRRLALAPCSPVRFSFIRLFLTREDARLRQSRTTTVKTNRAKQVKMKKEDLGSKDHRKICSSKKQISSLFLIF
jgi:hypothetical protein